MYNILEAEGKMGGEEKRESTGIESTATTHYGILWQKGGRGRSSR